jgi:hypothetical protein
MRVFHEAMQNTRGMASVRKADDIVRPRAAGALA